MTCTEHYNAEQHRHIDKRWLSQQSLTMRLVVWLFRSAVNHFAKCILSAAFERSIVTSKQFHELAAIIDRRLYPEYYKPKNTVVQTGNVCGGDMAGCDIIK